MKIGDIWFILFFLASVVFIILASNSVLQAPGDIFYVSTNGNDGNSGSESQPWRTIQKALDELSAGETAIIMEGIYREDLNARRSGSNGNLITLRGNGQVIIDGNNDNSNEGFFSDGHGFIRLENLEFRSWYKEGIFVKGSGNNRVEGIELVDIVVRGNGKRRGSWDHGISLEFVERVKLIDILADDNWANGIYVIGSEYVLIDGCVATSNDGDGGYFDDADGVLIQNSRYVIMNDCEARDNGEDGLDFGGQEQYGLDMQFAYVTDSRASNHPGNGFAVSGTTGSDFDTHDIYFRNSISYDNDGSGIQGYEGAYRLGFAGVVFHEDRWGFNLIQASHDYYIRNSISASNSDSNLNVKSNVYNVFAMYNNYWPGSPGNHAGNPHFSEDPRFESVGNGDFRLRSDSEMIDSGGPLTMTTSAGSGTSVSVEFSRWFHDGFGLIVGDTIRIGDETVVVTNVPNDNTLEIDRSISWNNDEWVGFPYAGSAPDIGAIEFGNIENIPPQEDPVCGDGIVEGVEECDDGNVNTEICVYSQTSCLVCDSNCELVDGEVIFCGDGEINADEECDDANQINGDGCSVDCLIEIVNETEANVTQDVNESMNFTLNETNNETNQMIEATNQSINDTNDSIDDPMNGSGVSDSGTGIGGSGSGGLETGAQGEVIIVDDVDNLEIPNKQTSSPAVALFLILFAILLVGLAVFLFLKLIRK